MKDKQSLSCCCYWRWCRRRRTKVRQLRTSKAGANDKSKQIKAKISSSQKQLKVKVVEQENAGDLLVTDGACDGSPPLLVMNESLQSAVDCLPSHAIFVSGTGDARYSPLRSSLSSNGNATEAELKHISLLCWSLPSNNRIASSQPTSLLSSARLYRSRSCCTLFNDNTPPIVLIEPIATKECYYYGGTPLMVRFMIARLA